MKILIATLLAAGFFGNVAAFSSQELRNYFEWGEYQQLIDSLEPVIVAVPCGFDSLTCAQYHNYIGVAYYGRGRVGEAQAQFRKALSFCQDVRPDSTYLSTELNGLFVATRNDFLEKLSSARAKDSLFSAEKEAQSASVTAIRQESVRKSRRAGVLLAVSFFTLSAATAAAAAYEYRATRQPYAEFSAAAKEGDKASYDRLRPQVGQANTIIAGCTAIAVVSTGVAVTFTVNSVRKR